MGTAEAISQRDLRLRSKEIMDAVETGQSFTVTRDGREIGELIPLRRDRRFVPVDEFLTAGRHLPAVDADAFLADVRGAFEDELTDPYAR